jgi:hypothetical protein
LTLKNQFSLAQFQDSIGVVTTRSMNPLGKEQTSQIKTSSASRSTSQWAGSRDNNLLVFRSREKFFLDIPFYRTHWACGESNFVRKNGTHNHWTTAKAFSSEEYLTLYWKQIGISVASAFGPDLL